MGNRPWLAAAVVVSWLFVAGVLVQVYLAGQALFAAAGWGAHATWIHAIELLPLVAFGLAWPARLRRSIAWWWLGLFFLTGAQYGLAAPGAPAALGALHPVNGFLVGALGLWLALLATSALRGAPTLDVTAPAPA